MGVVHLAFDPRVRRRVAIKTYHVPEGLSSEEEREFHERFLREAQAAGALSHPAIVTIYDADEDPGRKLPFIAMEFVEGRSLKEILASVGSLEAGQAFDRAETLAEALHKAHRAGVIHRDIKPANILVSEPDGAVKIADFGVARVAASDLTRTGHTLGSPTYMSPEQIRGQPADGRSDLFSLAVVLYEMLCGSRPFAGRDLTALAYAVVHEPPTLISERKQGLPAGLDAFFGKALAKSPDHRYPDGAAFREALRSVRAGATDASPGPVAEADHVITLIEATSSAVREQPAKRAARPAVSRVRSAASRLWKARPRTRATRAAVGLLAVLGLLATFAMVRAAGRATLVIEVRNKFEAAELTVFVDGDPVFTRSLAAERKATRMFGRKLFEHGQEEFDERIRIAAGRHEVSAEVTPQGQSFPYRDRVVVQLDPGARRRVELVAGGSAGEPLYLDLD